MTPIPPAAVEAAHEAAYAALTDLQADIARETAEYGYVSPKTLGLALRLVADDVLEAVAAAIREASQAEIAKLRERVRSQAAQLQMKDEALGRKSRELDALHMVWCSGGCRSGVHRWTDEKVTRELVETAERNTARLRTWYNSVKWRLEHYTAGTETDLHGTTFRPTEWHEQYARSNAEKTDLLPEVPQ